jgi:hypothetical protein
LLHGLSQAIMPTLMIVQTGFSHRAYRCCCPNNHDSKNPNDSVILDTVISGVRDIHHSPHHRDLEMGVDVDRHNREVAEINLSTVVSSGERAEDSKIEIELDEKMLDEKVDSHSPRTP